MLLNEDDRLRVQTQLVEDIESLNVIHERINVLLGQIAETIMKNEYKLIDRNRWILGLKLVQRMKRVETVNAQKREILSRIRKLILAPTAMD